ncbi:hypothetical protein [Photobacterium damselae]|uniref:Lysozyme inhibitor LprI N-terminal domain-containing protein n=2 Tax=Photobacterium damselae TaxID=38293 RepID=A0A2X1ZMV5_PHODM|nr:hypothetical protein [Photobacterium damselae]KAB1175279.1 hypothetical protein F6450_18715 [Photobacterium damselae subsp. damselae]KAB1175840.1 hypothetical protein F6477_19130 [Photobacterium damselae subsp. damselae]MBF7098588.1 hypothetical protein [Photobacterium damselae]MCG3824089.1 hypothetical protein [Photobacterium damselae]MDC4170110.1 hypothetical protein [Photobacterium damselae]
MKIYLFSVLVLSLSACAEKEPDITAILAQDAFAESYCDSGSVDYYDRSFASMITRHQIHISQLKDQLSTKNINQLNQAISEFNDTWASLIDSRNRSCKQNAICMYQNGQQGDKPELADQSCAKTLFEYDLTRLQLVEFYAEIERLEIHFN